MSAHRGFTARPLGVENDFSADPGSDHNHYIWYINPSS